MKLRQRLLHLQVHPLKLATDWVSALVAAALLWQHALAYGLIVAALPSMLVSIVLFWRADTNSFVRTALGSYMLRNNTPAMEGVRFCGMLVLWAGAWLGWWWLLWAGLAVIAGGWLAGMWPRRRTAA